MRPEGLVVYVHRAEKEALPTIEEMEISAGVAIFLVAQYTQAFVTGKADLTVESAKSIATIVVSLWQSGSYQPGPEYPFSLEETLLDLQNGLSVQKDYSTSFQSFMSSQANIPVGLGQVSGGIVLHPKTHLWQIWMMLDGPCEFLGAYRDASIAQQNFENIINAVRQGKKPEAALSLYQKLMSQTDSEPQQIPFDTRARPQWLTRSIPYPDGGTRDRDRPAAASRIPNLFLTLFFNGTNRQDRNNSSRLTPRVSHILKAIKVVLTR